MSRSIKDTIVLIDGLPDRIKELSFEQADELLDIINNYFAHGDVQVPKDHHQDQPRAEPPKPQDPPVTPKQPEPKAPEQTMGFPSKKTDSKTKLNFVQRLWRLLMRLLHISRE